MDARTHLGIALSLVDRAEDSTQLLARTNTARKHLVELLLAAEVAGRRSPVTERELALSLSVALGRLRLDSLDLCIDAREC
jgi:hypothetical protein